MPKTNSPSQFMHEKELYPFSLDHNLLIAWFALQLNCPYHTVLVLCYPDPGSIAECFISKRKRQVLCECLQINSLKIFLEALLLLLLLWNLNRDHFDFGLFMKIFYPSWLLLATQEATNKFFSTQDFKYKVDFPLNCFSLLQTVCALCPPNYEQFNWLFSRDQHCPQWQPW